MYTPYTFKKEYNLVKLNEEIMAANLPVCTIDWNSPNEFTVNTLTQLTNEEQNILTSIVDAHLIDD